jgi:hypothetical protein
MSKVTPIRATGKPAGVNTEAHTEDLARALRLLKLTMAAIGHDECALDAEPSEVREGIRAASGSISDWMEHQDHVEDAEYDVLGVLTLVDTVLAMGGNPSNGKTISPIKSAIKVACGLIAACVKRIDRQQAVQS